jgi:biotin carboxyl carrier protein
MEIRLGYGDATFRAVRQDGQVRVTAVSESPGVESAASPEAWHVERLPDGGFTIAGPQGRRRAEAVRTGETVWVRFAGRTYRFHILRGRRARPVLPGDLASPMPGRVQKILVREGAAVEADDPLLVVEAMKMQLEIKAPLAGKVSRLLAREGDLVEAGVQLVEIEAGP